MPSGISERLIQRALGPIDFSYAYQKIDNAAKQFAAEDKARKQSALKDYYTDLAAMNKDKAGLRSVDVPEVSGLYNEWSTIEKQLATNPNLISKNPELYGQLKNKSEETYSKLLTTIRGSKELGKQEQEEFKTMANPEKMDFYRDGAPAEYRKNVIERPWSQVVKDGTNDITKYYETKIDGSKFYGDLGQRIESQATQKHKIADQTFKGVAGEKRYMEFDKMPMLGEAQVVVADNLNAKLGKKADKFAVQQLEDAMATGDYQATKKKYEAFYDDTNPNGWKKYFDKKPVYVPLFQDGKPNKELFINYVTAKEFTSKLPEGRLGKVEFESESAKARYGSQLAFNKAVQLKKMKDSEGKGGDVPYVDAYKKIMDAVLASPIKAISPSKLDVSTQNVLLDLVAPSIGLKDLNNRYIYVKLEGDNLVVRSSVDLKDENGKTIIAEGGRIGELPREGLNIKASTPLGQKSKIAAKESPEYNMTPDFDMNQ